MKRSRFAVVAARGRHFGAVVAEGAIMGLNVDGKMLIAESSDVGKRLLLRRSR